MIYSEKMMAFCVTGHCNTESKVQKAINLIEKFKEKYPKEYVFFSSHYPIDPRIQKLTEFSVYDSDNQLANADYTDAISKLYRQTIWNFMPDYHLIKSIPHAGVAFHKNIFNLAKLAKDKKVNHIFFACADNDLVTIEYMDEHMKYHEEGYDAVYYPFFADKTIVNGEFWSLTPYGMKKIILSIKDSSDYYSFNTWMNEETTMRATKYHKVKYKMIDLMPPHGGLFGTDNLYKSVPDENQPPTLVMPNHLGLITIPYINIFDNYRLQFVAMMSQYQPENFESAQIQILYYSLNGNECEQKEDLVLSKNHYNIITPPANHPIVKVFRDGQFIFSFDLTDKRNYGDLIRIEDNDNCHVKLKG